MVPNAVIIRMLKRVKGSLPYLQVLAKSKPKLRKLLIDHVSPSVLAAICECSLNVLKGVIPLAPCQKQRLARYKTHLRALANKTVSKKQYLKQRGGGLLNVLLPPAIGVLGNLGINTDREVNTQLL